MAARTPRRYRTAAGTPRRQPRIRRASSGLTPIRSAALLAMLVSAGAIYGLIASPAFGFERLTVSGTSLTPEETVRSAVGLAEGTNLVGLDTAAIAGRLTELTTVAGADVAVGLPDQLEVRIRERRPIVIWAIGDRRFAVDETGLLFAEVTGAEGATATAVEGVAVVRDDRIAASALAIRSTLDPIDLDAATRLGSLTPSEVGSHAAGLTLRVTNERGFTVSSGNGGWVAIFGFYGRSQRTPALIPGQVQLLRALLAGREETVQTVVLADDRDGTYVAKPTPRPTATPKPSKTPKAP
jgi:POTRA domain, FtsQ-type